MKAKVILAMVSMMLFVVACDSNSDDGVMHVSDPMTCDVEETPVARVGTCAGNDGARGKYRIPLNKGDIDGVTAMAFDSRGDNVSRLETLHVIEKEATSCRTGRLKVLVPNGNFSELLLRLKDGASKCGEGGEGCTANFEGRRYDLDVSKDQQALESRVIAALEAGGVSASAAHNYLRLIDGMNPLDWAAMQNFDPCKGGGGGGNVTNRFVSIVNVYVAGNNNKLDMTGHDQSGSGTGTGGGGGSFTPTANGWQL